MAKYHGKGENRKKTIDNCKECNGKPPTTEKTLSGLVYTRCDLCFEVVTHGKSTQNKDSTAITSKDKSAVQFEISKSKAV